MTKFATATILGLATAMLAGPLHPADAAPGPSLVASFGDVATVACGAAPTVTYTLTNNAVVDIATTIAFAGTTTPVALAKGSTVTGTATGVALDCTKALALTATAATVKGPFATKAFPVLGVTYPAAAPRAPVGSFKLKLMTTCGQRPKVAVQRVSSPAAPAAPITFTIGSETSTAFSLTAGKTAAFEPAAALDCAAALPAVSYVIGTDAAIASAPASVSYAAPI